MPRNTKKSNPTQEIADAINTVPDLDWGDVAESLEITIPDLQERMASKVGDIALSWELIPSEHLPVIDTIKRELEAESSVRRLNEASEPPIAQPQQQTQEPPLVEEEPQPARRRGRPKKNTSALTQKKTESLQQSDEKAQQLAASDQQIKVALHAQKGQKSGAQLATIELAAEDATYRNIKGQALVRKVGQLTSEIASEANFDPIQVLNELGISANSDILEDLRQQIEPVLGKLTTATGEIVANAWVNGIDLETELGNLESLMNSNGSTSDYWQ